MKKMMAILLAVSLMIGSFTGCGGNESKETSDSGKETEVTDEKKTLRVAMECAYSPYNWTQEDAMADGEDVAEPIYGTEYYAYGYDVMLAKEICDYYGWNLEIHKVEWSNIIMGLQNGEYDVIIGGMKKTAERDETVDFTDPYYESSNCLLVKPDSPYVGATSLEDVRGISSTTQMNTALVPCLEEIPDVDEQPFYSSLSECVMAVTSGAVESCVVSIINAKIAAKTNDVAIIQFADGQGFTQGSDVCMAVQEGDKELLDQLNTALKEINWSEKAESYMDKAIECAPAE